MALEGIKDEGYLTRLLRIAPPWGGWLVILSRTAPRGCGSVFGMLTRVVLLTAVEACSRFNRDIVGCSRLDFFPVTCPKQPRISTKRDAPSRHSCRNPVKVGCFIDLEP
jgi:hypothetical protein